MERENARGAFIMGVPQVYRKSSEPAIASYSYIDIANGLGYQKFYLATLEDDDNTHYILNTNSIYSSVIESNQINTTDKTLTFSTSDFNLPKVVKGEAYICIGYENNYGIQTDGTCEVKVQKTSGGSTTDLCSYTGFDSSISSKNDGVVFSFKLDLTETNFKRGDILKVLIHLDGDSSGGLHQSVGHDPMNRDGSNITPSTQSSTTTASFILVPFKIDL